MYVMVTYVLRYTSINYIWMKFKIGDLKGVFYKTILRI